jgi:rare lipoprotein A
MHRNVKAAPPNTSAAGIALLGLLLFAQSCALQAPSDTSSPLPPGQVPQETREPETKTTEPEITQPNQIHTGHASWYGPKFEGKRTASGEIFSGDQLTAASRILPLGSRARVTNLENGKSVEVKINDRGPFVEGRIIDLSRAAARVLDMLKTGIAKVRVELLSAINP